MIAWSAGVWAWWVVMVVVASVLIAFLEPAWSRLMGRLGAERWHEHRRREEPRLVVSGRDVLEVVTTETLRHRHRWARRPHPARRLGDALFVEPDDGTEVFE